MPKGVPSDLAFGMSLDEFKRAMDMNTMKVDNTRSWRLVYYQPSKDPEIKSLIYYIAKDVKAQPLYQVIISYTREQLAQENALHYFGLPNYVGEDSKEPNEWRLEARQGVLAKWAWVYKSQIVMVARVPGCEWDEDWDDN